MKINIITIVYNGSAYIEGTLQSVLGQKLPKDIELEYIVIDGGSTDGTVEIIEKYRSQLAYFSSERDKGIYDAMNKGLAQASGDIIGILNADDFYTDETVLLKVVHAFKSHEGVDAVYADLEYVDANNIKKVVRYWKSQKYVKGLFRTGWHPAHPTFFVKGSVYKKWGVFDTSLSIAADYELMLRFMHVHAIDTFYIPQILVQMRTGGASNADIKSIWKANKESYKAWRMNNFSIAVSVVATMRKPLSKIRQLFKRKIS